MAIREALMQLEAKHPKFKMSMEVLGYAKNEPLESGPGGTLGMGEGGLTLR